MCVMRFQMWMLDVFSSWHPYENVLHRAQWNEVRVFSAVSSCRCQVQTMKDWIFWISSFAWVSNADWHPWRLQPREQIPWAAVERVGNTHKSNLPERIWVVMHGRVCVCTHISHLSRKKVTISQRETILASKECLKMHKLSKTISYGNPNPRLSQMQFNILC